MVQKGIDIFDPFSAPVESQSGGIGTAVTRAIKDFYTEEEIRQKSDLTPRQIENIELVRMDKRYIMDGEELDFDRIVTDLMADYVSKQRKGRMEWQEVMKALAVVEAKLMSRMQKLIGGEGEG